MAITRGDAAAIVGAVSGGRPGLPPVNREPAREDPLDALFEQALAGYNSGGGGAPSGLGAGAGGLDVSKLQQIAQGFGESPFDMTGEQQAQSLQNIDLGSFLGLDPRSVRSARSAADSGLLTTSSLQKLLFGEEPGGAGGGSGIGWAQLAEQRKQNEFARMLSYLSMIQEEQQRASREQSGYLQNLLSAAPQLAAGRPFVGGFGPYGGGTLLEMLQGGPGAPQNLSVMPFQMDQPGPADTSQIEQLLGPLLQ